MTKPDNDKRTLPQHSSRKEENFLRNYGNKRRILESKNGAITQTYLRKDKQNKTNDETNAPSISPSSTTAPSMAPTTSSPPSGSTFGPATVPPKNEDLSRNSEPEQRDGEDPSITRTQGTDEEHDDNQVVDFPDITIIFSLSRFDSGQPLENEPFQNTIFNFLEYMLADRQVAVNVDFQATISYDPFLGNGTAEIAGTWIGHSGNAPTEALFIGAFRGWGINALRQELRAAGFPTNELSVRVNQQPIQPLVSNDTTQNEQEQKQSGNQKISSSSFSAIPWVMPLAVLVFFLPWMILIGNVVRKRLSLSRSQQQHHHNPQSPEAAMIRRRPSNSELPREAPIFHEAVGTATKANQPAGSPSRHRGAQYNLHDHSKEDKKSSFDKLNDDSFDCTSHGSSSSGYSGLFVGPQNDDVDLSSMYFL